MSDNAIDPASLDLSNLREITGGDAEVEKELFVAFIECGEESLAALSRIAADGEQTEWKEQSHALKGQSANLGAGKLAQLAHDSQMAFAASKDEKEKLLAAIKSEWDVVLGYLSALQGDE